MCSSTVYSLRPAKEVILAFELYPTKKVILGEVGPVLNHAFIGLCMHAPGYLPTAHSIGWELACMHACTHKTKSFLVLRNCLAPEH